MIFFIVLLPISAGVGITLLSGLVASPHRHRWALLERLTVIVSLLWVVLTLMVFLERWGSAQMFYIRMAAAIVAGTMLHLLLGWRMWRRGVRLSALQLFALAIFLPLSMVAPFFDPRMQGPSALGLFPFAWSLPALGAPHYSGELLIDVTTSFANDPGRTIQSFWELHGVSPYIGPALITPIWAAGMMAFLAYVFIRDLVKRPAAERTA